MIPKIIHYCWFGGNPLPELAQKCIDSWAHYHYWSKTECEMAIGGLHCKYPDEFEKVDMYRQIEINLDKIVKYVIDEMCIVF